jgi:nanoRNase/pAp phosphatase (c-di-AMP/oligoRNAs hydrolase)
MKSQRAFCRLLASFFLLQQETAFAFGPPPLKKNIAGVQSFALAAKQLNESPNQGEFDSYSAKFLDDNGLTIVEEEDGRVTAKLEVRESETKEKSSLSNALPPLTTTTDNTKTNDLQPNAKKKALPALKLQHPKIRRNPIQEHPAQVVPASGFNVVLTHVTADFDSLAAAVGLAKLWSQEHSNSTVSTGGINEKKFDSKSDVPTFVVLPRGAHPSVHRFLNLHKHLFPIRSLKSLPTDLSGLNRLGLVDAQRRDRLGPAENLLQKANRVTIVDHHVDMASDIREATDYVVDKVGSVSTLIVERLQESSIVLTEAEATLLALGIHADTGSLVYDSTTPRDAKALAWLLELGASQAAIAEHAQASLSQEQQGVLTQALLNTNATEIHGVTVSTVLLKADGFINGLATVAKDALELSSSDVFLLGVVYEPSRSSRKGGSPKQQSPEQYQLPAALLKDLKKVRNQDINSADNTFDDQEWHSAWRGGKEALQRGRLRRAFERCDTNGSGYLERSEIISALSTSGTILTGNAVGVLLERYDMDRDGRIDFDEFVAFAKDAQDWQEEEDKHRRPCSLIIIGRAKAGVTLKDVRLHRLLEKYGGGGHAKAASTTVRLNDESEAEGILQNLVDELIETSLTKQPCVGDFMTAPVLSAKPHMTEKQVEDLFTRHDVRALPVVDDRNDVIGLVTYKEVAAAKQRLFNKEVKRQKQADARAEKGVTEEEQIASAERKLGSALKGWMKQHVTVIPASMTMAEVEAVLLENDVGCVPVVEDGTMKLVGMVTRTDLLRQHRYYPSLHYHNKGFSDSIAARQPIIELRRRLKKFDLDE